MSLPLKIYDTGKSLPYLRLEILRMKVLNVSTTNLPINSGNNSTKTAFAPHRRAWLRIYLQLASSQVKSTSKVLNSPLTEAL